ncbi:hypothetical protein B0H10DRAFT_2059583, partial [Mycena sp. CBHHK59/15]
DIALPRITSPGSHRTLLRLGAGDSRASHKEGSRSVYHPYPNDDCEGHAGVRCTLGYGDNSEWVGM